MQRALVGLGPDVIPALFQILVQGEIPPIRAERAKRLTATAELAVVAALEALPRRPLRSLLDEVAAQPREQAARQQGLRLLARFGTAEDLRRATKLARHDEGSPPVLRAAYGAAIEQILLRDPQGLRDPALDFVHLSPALHRATAGAIGSLGTRSAFEHLAGHVDLRGTATPILLLELRRLAAKLPVPPDPSDLTGIRGALFSSDPTIVNLAAGVLRELRDAASMPDLIATLPSPDPNAQRAVRAALATIANVDLGTDADRWYAWYSAQLGWLENTGDALARAIADGPVQDALAAITTASSRYALSGAAVELLLPGLLRSEPILVERTSTALGNLRSWRAVPDLLDTLELAPGAGSDAACTALKRITSLDLPADAAVWRARLRDLEELQ